MITYHRCKISSKGQVTLPKSVRDELGIETGTELQIGTSREGEVILKKVVEPGFFDEFVGLLASQTPFANGDEAREAMRLQEDPTPYQVSIKSQATYKKKGQK
jgi:AbrB family looped-hinge helix DNA binding protein